MVRMVLIAGWLGIAGGIQSMALNIGDVAPPFTATIADGTTLSLKDYEGQWVVLYFYPKADTPGCTKQSCSLRDGYGDIRAEGAVLLGASLDSVSKQLAFREKYDLPFPLIADENKVIAKAYNVLAPLGIFAHRKTFLIDPEGHIAHIFSSVNVADHDAEVLAVLRSLKAPETSISED